MEQKNIQVVEISGTPYERGLQYGQAVKDKIQKAVKDWELALHRNQLRDPEAYLRDFLDYGDFMPADLAGLKTKGLIKEGLDADIVIFDLDSLTDHADYIHTDKKHTGMKYVIVNGVVAVQNDCFLGRHAGKLLRRA